MTTSDIESIADRYRNRQLNAYLDSIDEGELPLCAECGHQLTDAEFQWGDGVHCKECQTTERGKP